jgi:carboxymethylenebutenolidase
MIRKRLVELGILALVSATAPSALAQQSPERLSGSHVSPAVWGVLAVPRAPGPHPAVVVLPGAGGWHSWYPEVAQALADSGFVTLALDYYAETGGAAIGSDEKLRKWPTWQATIRNAVQYLEALPSVAGRPVGLVGYSRGAFLAVSVGASTSGVRAVVDYFGGGGGGTDSLEQEARGFPSLLILHGDADQVVPVRFAENLRKAVVAQGGQVEMHLYPGRHHAFNMPGMSTYSEAAAEDAFRRTVHFLRRRLAQ